MNDPIPSVSPQLPRRLSFALILGLLGLTAALHLATPVLTILFSTFVLGRLNSVVTRRWLAVVLFAAIVLLVFYGFAYFIHHAARALPNAAEEAIPKIIAFANENKIELPFHDLVSLKSMASEEISDLLKYLANFAKLATKEFVYLVIGLVVASSISLNATLDINPEKHAVTRNLYSACCREIIQRFITFYQSFETVMGAQITISLINTALTAIFIFSTSMKYSLVLVGVTFLCGMLPIIGNILSNCVIVGVGFTMSPTMAIAALIFLVLLHKLEYFLNSKIIGDRISNPVWLTLMGLVVGEKIMGIPGMILAPVALYYLKVETGRIGLSDTGPT